MRYHFTMNPNANHKGEVGTVSNHIDAVSVLLRGVRERRKVSLEVELRSGARAEVGWAWQPYGKRKPWTHSIMAPDYIRAFHPTVKLGDTHAPLALATR